MRGVGAHSRAEERRVGRRGARGREQCPAQAVLGPGAFAQELGSGESSYRDDTGRRGGAAGIERDDGRGRGRRPLGPMLGWDKAWATRWAARVQVDVGLRGGPDGQGPGGAGLRVRRVPDGSSSRARGPRRGRVVLVAGHRPRRGRVVLGGSARPELLQTPLAAFARVCVLHGGGVRGLRCPGRGGGVRSGLGLGSSGPELGAAQILGCVGATLAQSALST